jgi:phosphotransferase system enzyme I (PtsI)
MSAQDENLFHGIGIGRGTAVGPVLRMPDPIPDPVDQTSALSAPQEFARARDALSAVARQFRERGEIAGGAAREILDALAMMAEDPTLTADIQHRTQAGATAEFAVYAAMGSFSDALAGLGGYLAERAGDLDDVARRAIGQLQGLPAPGVPSSRSPFVLVARDLAPADTVTLDPDLVLALITSDGGPTSHTAILAREKGITAVVGASGALTLHDGDVVVVDAGSGTIERDPSRDRIDRSLVDTAALRAIRVQNPGSGLLADGYSVPLLANIGSVETAREAVARGAQGVGLFRTEMVFLGASVPPSLEEQEATYRAVFDLFPEQKVVVRVLDAGADKPLLFLGDAGEQNPALGRRGLRALTAQEDILRGQLKALARAADGSQAQVHVMAPMVSTAAEARYFGDLAHELGLAVAGVVVEVPSCAILADHVARHTDFMSIGTNDLTQYVFAADRMLSSVAHFHDPWHPAVLRLIQIVGTAGATHNVPVGICGEAAADPRLAVVLVGLGATSLSMAPSAIADVRAELSLHSLDDARRLALLAVSADSAEAARLAVLQASSGRR